MDMTPNGRIVLTDDEKRILRDVETELENCLFWQTVSEGYELTQREIPTPA